MMRTACSALFAFGLAVASSTVNASLIGASVAADLDGDPTLPTVIDSGLEFAFADATGDLVRSANFDDISVTLRYTNLSSEPDPADFGPSFWTFLFTDWPGIPQAITDVIPDATNPSGAVIEAVDSDLIAISLPALGVQTDSSVEWRFEILTNHVPEPATVFLIALGLAGIGYQGASKSKRRKTLSLSSQTDPASAGFLMCASG